MSDFEFIEMHVIEEKGVTRAILPEARIHAVPQSGAPNMMPDTDSSPGPTEGPFPDDETLGYRWAPWGINDCLPTQIREKIYSVPMAAQAIYRLTQMMFGNGIAYFRNEELQDGPKVSRAYIPKIEQFLRKNRINTKFLPGQFVDHRFNMNSFSEIIFNKRRDMVTNIYHKTAEFCRLSVQNPKTFEIEWLYYSPEFANGRYPINNKIRKVRLFQWEEEEEFLQKLSGYKFAWHSRFETPGITYYARPFWLGLFRKDGWVDVSARVPEIVNAMMNNQIILKYHILIPVSYFKVRYPEWDVYDHTQRERIIDKLIDKINNTLSGTTNAFQSISTVFDQDPITQQAQGKIEIVAVDDKVKKDAWVPSSQAADAQIVQGLGLHPSQVGLSPEGGKMGAGSGSDQRESFNTGISLNTLEQMILLEPLNWIAQFNSQTDPDWDITFFIDHTHHTTTNNEEDGMAPSSTTIQPQ